MQAELTPSLYKWIKENVPRDLQILCHNCNAAKQIYGICPHSRINNAG